MNKTRHILTGIGWAIASIISLVPMIGESADYTPPAWREHMIPPSHQPITPLYETLPKGLACHVTDPSDWGDPDASASLADALLDGDAFAPDPKAAFHCYERAACEGSTYAQYMVSVLYQLGIGTQQDIHWSERYFQVAQHASDRFEAQWEVASRFLDHRTAISDPEQAEAWLKRSAQGGYLPAEDALGDFYEMGRGGFPNWALAEQWYRQAASLGYAAAQYHLGLLLLRQLPNLPDKSFDSDVTEALDLLNKSAYQGYPASQLSLAQLYADGQWVDQDWAQAYAWWQLAQPEAQSPDFDRRMNEAMRHWSAKTRHRAIHLAREYRSRYSID